MTDVRGQQSILVAGRPLAGYQTITADPPWAYDDTGIRGAAEHHYPTMTVEEICAMPVAGLGAEDSHLYLWVTNAFLEQGFAVMRAWGYRYIVTITWIKDRIGCGHYFRNTTEHVLFGVRGSARLKVANLPTHFNARRGAHSAKPEAFYKLVERGEVRKGWAGWGNEASGGDVVQLEGLKRSILTLAEIVG